ncbi:aminotransferase class IV family protein [Kitasatospora sp. NPDC054939]
MTPIEIDGEPADPARAAALGLLNYGHFTTLRADGGRVRGLGLHLERLVRDCRVVFGTELDGAAVRERVRAVLPAEGPAIVRVTVFDPELGLERPGADPRPRLMVSVRPAPAGEPAPLRVRTAGYQRELPQVKHTGLFGLVRQRRLAQLDGCDDALLVDARGAVTEGTTWNVGFVDDGGVVWPDGACLPGVTAALLSAAHGGPQRRATVRAGEVGRFAAAFATNAGVGVRPIARIDGTDVDPAHPLLGELRAAYAGVTAEPV